MDNADLTIRIRPPNAHWLYPAALRCGRAGPHWLVQWLALREWLYENRAARSRETNSEWRLLVRSVWYMRKVFAGGDLAAVIAAHGVATQHLYLAHAEFKARQRSDNGRHGVDQDEVRAFALVAKLENPRGYLKRTASEFGITPDRVGQILRSKKITK